ncbi:MAG: quinolinate synthase NadA [Candidatus Gracilibacteria bacterium]|jgi:quinolinate synthase
MTLTKEQKGLVEKIIKLKKAKNAVILAHNYQRPEIYEVADFIGDSLELCRKAVTTSAKIILFCGVNFMAESAAILNPEKKVIVPYLDAGCAMADMVTARSLHEFKKKYPRAKVVCYVNSSASVKAESDICCTSSNAAKVVKSLKEKEIIFVPDKNLADYVQKQVPDKKIIPWQGFCPVHHSLTKEYILDVKKTYPNAEILAHPECRPEVLELADHISSTSGMVWCAKNSKAKEFFVLTECGMVERLNRELPDKKFYGLCNMCFDMKKNTLPAVLKCLEDEKPVVRVDKKVALKAGKAFDRMFAVA